MNDFPLVNVLACLDQLINVVSRFNLVQSFASPDQVRQRLVMTNVKHDVHIFSVFEVPVKANYIFVAH